MSSPAPQEPEDNAPEKLIACATTSSPAQWQELCQQLAQKPAETLAPLFNALLQKNCAESRKVLLGILILAPETLSLAPDVWRALAADPEREARAQALDAVKILERARAAPLLRFFEQDPDEVLRRRVLTWLLMAQDELALQAALRHVSDSDPGIRRQVARFLIRVKSEEATHALGTLAHDSDPRCRADALQELLTRHAPGALLAAARLERNGGEGALDALTVFSRFTAEQLEPVLRHILSAPEYDQTPPEPQDVALLLRRLAPDLLSGLRLRDNPQWVRAALLYYDAQLPLGCDEAIQHLLAACSDPSPPVRQQALQALARHEEVAESNCFAQMLEHPDAELRRFALEFLARSGSRALVHLRAALSDADGAVRKRAYELLLQVDPDEELATCKRALRDPDQALRRWAVERLLQRAFDPLVCEALCTAARSRDEDIRNQAACALAQRKIHQTRLAAIYRQTLKSAIASTGPYFNSERTLALVNAVAELYPSGSAEVLLAACRARSALVRRGAVDAIFKKGHKLALAAASALIDTDDPDILRRVATLLGKDGDPRGLIPIIRACDECTGAADALQPLLRKYPQTRQLKFLLSSLRQPWPAIKRFAAKALYELDSPEMIEPLLSATRDPDPELQRAALQALQKYSKYPEVTARLLELRDSSGDESTRQQAIGMLLGMDSGSVVAPLLEATRDEDVEVQFAAVKALGKYANRPEVYQRLIEILDYGDIALREKCIETLGDAQIKEAVDPLIRMLANPFLKFRVQEALMRIGDRRGFLAIKRHKIREKYFGKKKSKGPVAPLLRKRKGR